MDMAKKTDHKEVFLEEAVEGTATQTRAPPVDLVQVPAKVEAKEGIGNNESIRSIQKGI